jgi:hypothetical protein
LQFTTPPLAEGCLFFIFYRRLRSSQFLGSVVVRVFLQVSVLDHHKIKF